MNLKQGYHKEAAGARKRFCQFLQLNPETIEEYKYWHKNIWKEIPEGIRKAGILDMEIFFIKDMAFMIVETPLDFDWDVAFGRLAFFERQAEWEAFVGKFQMSVVGTGDVQSLRSEEKWQLMERIFSLPEALNVRE